MSLVSVKPVDMSVSCSSSSSGLSSGKIEKIEANKKHAKIYLPINIKEFLSEFKLWIEECFDLRQNKGMYITIDFEREVSTDNLLSIQFGQGFSHFIFFAKYLE